jgi:hypothetical protein
LPAPSPGIRAVSASSASVVDLFHYAENGCAVTAVQTTIPANRYGEQPDRFMTELAAAGLLSGGESKSVRATAMALAQLVCGIARRCSTSRCPPR